MTSFLKTAVVNLATAFAIFTVQHANAASDPFLDVVVTSTVGACATTEWEVQFGANAGTDDSGGLDFVGVLVYQPDGTRIASDWRGFSVPGFDQEQRAPFGNGTGMNDLTQSPLIVEFIDLATNPPGGTNLDSIFDDIESQRDGGAPIMASMNYVPSSDIPDCSSLPGSPSTTPVPTLGPYGLFWFILAVGLVGLYRARPRAS